MSVKLHPNVNGVCVYVCLSVCLLVSHCWVLNLTANNERWWRQWRLHVQWVLNLHLSRLSTRNHTSCTVGSQPPSLPSVNTQPQSCTVGSQPPSLPSVDIIHLHNLLKPHFWLFCLTGIFQVALKVANRRNDVESLLTTDAVHHVSQQTVTQHWNGWLFWVAPFPLNQIRYIHGAKQGIWQ